MDKLFEAFQKKGLSAPHAAGFMPYTAKDGKFIIDHERMAAQMARDAATITAPAVGVPAQLVTYIDPNVVQILFTATKATKIYGERRVGEFTDRTMIFPVEEYAGEVTPYSDFADNTSSDVAYEYPQRDSYQFQTVIKYGDREVAEAARAKTDLVSAKQRAASTIIAHAHNQFYLFGVAGRAIYGILNDPNLASSISPITVGANSTWATKIAADPDGAANIVFNDISKLWANLTAKNGGNIDATSPIILAISNAMAPYLVTPNQFGLTAKAMLSANFPNLTIVEVPELTTAGGEMLYMTVPNLFGTDTGFTAYSEKMRFGRVVPQLSSYQQKCFGSTWGAVIARPSLVSTMLGIG